jgi:hypothetical protein
MRRSPLLTIQIFCPHFERPVEARRNETTERLVDCTSKAECVTEKTADSGVTVAVFPKGCPVFK